MSGKQDRDLIFRVGFGADNLSPIALHLFPQ
jgi:hypothetical protein